MGRLIDVNKFKADYGMKDDCADCDKELRGKSKACEYDRVYTKMDFCGWLDDAPAVDAVEVVRCKDCMHYGFTNNRIPEEQVWWCYFWDDVRSPDAYCSDGEREDSEHEKAD